jgi:hypothetical protein
MNAAFGRLIFVTGELTLSTPRAVRYGRAGEWRYSGIALRKGLESRQVP